MRTPMPMGNDREGSSVRRGSELSLSSRTLPEASAAEMVSAAAAAGFDAAGLWVDPQNWDSSITRSVRERLDDSGLGVLDVEALTIAPEVADSTLRRIIEIGAELNARYALVIGVDPEPSRIADRFAGLCEHAASRGIRPALEFMRFTSVRTLADALDIVQAAGHPAGAVLIDMLHLARSGGKPEDLPGIDPDALPYAQICDAPAEPQGEDPGGLIAEALQGRLLPGDGALPIQEILAHLPAEVPLSCEILSSDLHERFPDPVARAKAVGDTTRAFLRRILTRGPTRGPCLTN
jgi:sugar phosphate isomerase/epimerase